MQKNGKRGGKTIFSFKSRAMSPNAAFTQKLHLIYLINDLLHHWLVEKHLLKAFCVLYRECI